MPDHLSFDDLLAAGHIAYSVLEQQSGLQSERLHFSLVALCFILNIAVFSSFFLLFLILATETRDIYIFSLGFCTYIIFCTYMLSILLLIITTIMKYLNFIREEGKYSEDGKERKTRNN